jgi:hypothetical protein
MSKSIPVGNRPRCNRHILVMSPEPSEWDIAVRHPEAFAVVTDIVTE